MDILIIMDRLDGQHLAGEHVLRNYYSGDTITTKSLNAVVTADVSTWIDTLDDAAYDRIHTLVTVQASGATGVVSSDQYAELIRKMKADALPAVIAEGTAQSNATGTEIILASATDEVDNYFNDMYILTAGTTAVGRVITDFVSSTDTVTVADTSTAITTTETYEIYDGDDLTNMPIYDGTYEAQDVWDALYPDMNHTPRFIEELGAMPATGTATATADSVATSSGVSSLTDASAFTADEYIGYFVAIRSGTTGAGQVIEIESNTDSVLTLKDKWHPIPTGTIVYEIVDRKHVAIARYFLQFALRYLTPDPSDNDQLRLIMKMISNNESISTTDEFTFQDLEALEEFKATGQTIMRAIGMAITS